LRGLQSGCGGHMPAHGPRSASTTASSSPIGTFTDEPSVVR
jgi:hypothetical protein